MNTETARATLAHLEQKLTDASARAIELQTERQRISFDANTGDEAARQRLDKANTASTTVALELENISSAIREAKRRLAEAERAEEVAQLSANAEAAVEIADRLAERGRKIDAALAIVAEQATGYMADISELNRLGCSHPRAEQFSVLGEMVVSAALMDSPLKLRHLAPKDRRTLAELSNGWRDTVVRWASQFLSKEAA